MQATEAIMRRLQKDPVFAFWRGVETLVASEGKLLAAADPLEEGLDA